MTAGRTGVVRPGVLALAFAAAAAITPRARADETADLESLLDESVVSTVSKSAETATVAPATSTTITAEDLRRHGIRSLDDAVNFLSLGMITENPLHAVEIGARGVLLTGDYGDHVLLLVDGHVMNEAWGGTAYFDRAAAIPFEMIDHIEVILGPGSVLYGSNAMLGVINVVTKRAKDYDGLHVIAEGEGPGVIGRAAVGFGRELRLFGRPSEVTAQVEYYRQSGPAYAFGPQHYGVDGVTGQPKVFSTKHGPPGTWGGVAEDSYYAEIPAGYVRFKSGGFEASVRAASYERATPYQGGVFDDADNHEIDRWLSADLAYRATVSPIVTLGARLYGDSYDYRQFVPSLAAEDCLAGQSNGCLFQLLGVARWAGAEGQASLDWLRDGALVTLLGVEGRLKHVASKVDITDRVTGDNPGSSGDYRRDEKALAAYAQQVAHPAAWLGLGAGARLDVDERFGSHFSPRLAVTLSPWKGGTLKGVYAEAFRAPGAFERYYEDPTGQIAAPDLRPETVASIEASLEQKIGAHRVLFGVFRSTWQDMVGSDALSPDEIAAAVARGELTPGVGSAFQYRNISSIEDIGYDIAIQGALLDRRLRYAVNFVSAEARQKATVGSTRPTPLSVAAPVFGNARVSYQFGEAGPTVGLAARVAARRPSNAVDDPSYAVAPYAPAQTELRAALSGPIGFVKGLSYGSSVNYAFATRSPYAVGPGAADHPFAELAPLPRIRVALGLEYDVSP